MNALVCEAAATNVDIMRQEWPLCIHLALGTLPSAVPCARLHARHVLWDWHLKPIAGSVELIVTELITNGIRAARPTGLPVRFWMLSDRASVLVLVWDASPHPPILVRPGDDTEDGRGLMLVDAISTRWDWYPVTDTIGGKVI